MDARPDQEEMGSDGWRSKRRRASRTWPPYCHSCPSLHKGPLAPCLWQRLWRLVFSQHWTKIRPICSPRWSCACIDTLRTTGYYPRNQGQDILGYQTVIPVYWTLFGDILGLSTWQFLSCGCLKIAPYNHINVTFWCMLTTQCIIFVRIPLNVTVHIRGYLCCNSPGLGPLLPQLRQFIGQWAVWGFSSSNVRLVASHSPKKCKFMS